MVTDTTENISASIIMHSAVMLAVVRGDTDFQQGRAAEHRFQTGVKLKMNCRSPEGTAVSLAVVREECRSSTWVTAVNLPVCIFLNIVIGSLCKYTDRH